MTRRCSWCGALLSEKCPRCGSLALLSYVPLTRRVWTYICQTDDSDKPKLRFDCSNCGLAFDEGEGGTTSTICKRCIIQSKQQATT